MRQSLRYIARKIALLSAVAASSVITQTANSSSEDLIALNLNGYEFRIPSRYREESNFLAWPRWLPHLDKTSAEIFLRIDATEVAAAIRGFNPKIDQYKDDLRLRLVVLSDGERDQYLSTSSFVDMWDGTGSFKDRIIELEKNSQTVRVFRRVEHPYSWEALSIHPNQTIPKDLFSFWLGHCLETKSLVTTTNKLALCKSFILVGNIAVHYTLSATNLGRTSEIRKWLKTQVTRWLQEAPRDTR